MCTNKLSFILSVFAFFFIEELITSCSGLKEPNSEGAAELRLYWIGDSHPHNITNTWGECDTRIVSLHYFLINNTGKHLFLPIAPSSISPDSIFCSRIQLLIDEKNVETLFYPDTRWNGGVINPYDSIRAHIMIPERLLDSMNINKRISPQNLLSRVNIKYQECQSDTLWSKMPIADLKFTQNDTIGFVFADTVLKVCQTHGQIVGRTITDSSEAMGTGRLK